MVFVQNQTLSPYIARSNNGLNTSSGSTSHTQDAAMPDFMRWFGGDPDATDFTQTARDINAWLNQWLFDSSVPDLDSSSVSFMSQMNAAGSACEECAAEPVLETAPANTATGSRPVTASVRTSSQSSGNTPSPMADQIIAAAKARTDGVNRGRGGCAKGVRKTFEDLGIRGVRASHAYQMADVLAKDSRFIEVDYSKRLPGDVVVLSARHTPDKNGKKHPSGHAEIVLPNGLASSDYQAAERDPENYGPEPPRVFRYIG